jgi:hypothetical protein
MSAPIATVAQLCLYPVKSMAGVSIEQAHVGLDGFLGDRQYAFVQAGRAMRDTFPWMTGRQSARMLQYKPAFTRLPTPDDPEPPVEVRAPDGHVYEPADPKLCEEIAGLHGQPVFLLKSGRGIFDCQSISLFSMASVRALATEAGCAIDPRQFRANVYMEPADGRPFEEEQWTGRILRLGADVLAGVAQRDTRCMMVNLNPESGVQDARVLRAIAQGHQGQAGLYLNVLRPGVIRRGDAIQLVANFA